jgi:predicted nucleotidyltransferase
MKVLGIVSEYNPFHNGHRFHIEESKKATGCDTVVCVMSGNFIQRGEPAIVNKFARAEMALLNGVDLVLELPVPFAMSSAEPFAFGAVKILDSIGIVDCVSFGSESGDIQALQNIAGILASEPPEFRRELKKQLNTGVSFPAARQRALHIFLTDNQPESIAAKLSEQLESSNNILSLEYLKALSRLKSTIHPYTIKRISNEYNTPSLTGTVSSATAIRNSILEADNGAADAYLLNEAASQALPQSSRNILNNEFSQGRGPNNIYLFESILLSVLRRITVRELSEIPDVSEGLEYRIKTVSECSGSIDQLLEGICTRRYTKTRIQRILLSALTGVTRHDMESFMRYGGPQYARVLGFNNAGRMLLSRMKKESAIPVISKTSDFRKSDNRLVSRMLEIENQATDTYVLGYKNPAFRKAGQEFTQNIVIIR